MCYSSMLVLREKCFITNGLNKNSGIEQEQWECRGSWDIMLSSSRSFPALLFQGEYIIQGGQLETRKKKKNHFMKDGEWRQFSSSFLWTN